jgi:hypothetical protein
VLVVPDGFELWATLQMGAYSVTLLSDFGICVEGGGGMFRQGFSAEEENTHVTRRQLEIELSRSQRDCCYACQGCCFLPCDY